MWNLLFLSMLEAMLLCCNIEDSKTLMLDRDQIHAQVEKLVSSHVLHGSESLCKLVRYLAKQSLDHPGVPVKEYQIATEVFGRPADFDPQSDSAIRVQAGRLRAKLSEYYVSEGAEDPVYVELPKGSYVLNFQSRRNGKEHASEAPVSEPSIAPEPGSSRLVVALAVLSAVLAMALLMVMMDRRRDVGVATNVATVSPALQTFWKPFTVGPGEPWVIFSNAAFVGRPETGIRYYDPAKDPAQKIWDHYTGVGEVLAVHSLDQVFSQLHQRIRVKRGSLLSLDDVSNNDLIFLGSPSENLTLKDLPNTQTFVFQRLTAGPRKGDLAIVNLHPQSGEQKESVASRSGEPLTDDYALVVLLPGINPARSVMILAGTTTFGTQGAAEFLTREDAVRQLLTKLDSGNKLVPFEALVHVKITRGVPLKTELVTVKKR
jgi:hypothetical protein